MFVTDGLCRKLLVGMRAFSMESGDSVKEEREAYQKVSRQLPCQSHLMAAHSLSLSAQIVHQS